MATYTVKAGDCLWNIAQATLGNALRWVEIADLNGISRNYPLIHPGDVLNLPGGGGSTTPPKPAQTKPAIQYFGLQAGTDKSVFCTWTWDRENTEHYETKWYYDTGQGVWFVGSDSTVKEKQCVYSAPSNAKKVRFIVKAISQKRDVNGTETSYWTGEWSTEKIYDFANNPPSKPPRPSVEIDKYTLTAELDNLDVNGTAIQFEIVRDNKTVFNTGKANIVTGHAAYSCTISAGSEYKVRCRAVRGTLYGDWSEYSDNQNTIPAIPDRLITCKANSETSVYLEWSAVSNAKSYDIEYTTKSEYFDGSDKTTTSSGIEFTHFEKTGLETGEEYFFRVRAVNEQGRSGWSEIKSVRIGKKPAPPTTWSSTTTAITGEPLNLYWVHNAEDGSSQTFGEVELIIDGRTETYTIKNDRPDDEKDKTSVYEIDTKKYSEGTKIQWRVRTAGVTKQYGDWSIQRTIDIYAPPTLTFKVTDIDSNAITNLDSFPFYVSAIAGPNTQVPIGYHLVITSEEIYETVDEIGKIKMVNKGEQVYSKYFDTREPLLVEFSANNIDLENNITYTISCTVSMNSGLTTEQHMSFKVLWSEDKYEPNAEIGFDKDTISTFIRPYCEGVDGELIDGVMLSVYRKEFDGSFTELIKNVDNSKSVFITDPHPALDLARYRVVATTKNTGAVSYCDIPGYPIGEHAIIIQWDDQWSNFDNDSEEILAQPTWSGSMLRLPYNVDVSEDYNPEATLVKYAGRKHPVTYYGTQLGSKSNWSVAVPKRDKETLYGLRRLATWTGDVYVREPSGSGYWANVQVSFSQTHCELTIPVSLSITRVDGGV